MSAAKTTLTEYNATPPRLPMPRGLAERYSDMGVDAISWRTLTDVLYPAAKTPESVMMLLSYCKSRNLDPFKRPAHIVPMWSSEKRTYIDTVWPGIAELRTTAVRTGQYAGRGDLVFGPMITRTFEGIVSDKKVSYEVTFPEYAQMTVYRMLDGQRCAFQGDPVFWLETYARTGRSEVPNEMWRRRARGQLIKCAEASALRVAFPEELGSDYTIEEMEGQSLGAIMPEPERQSRRTTTLIGLASGDDAGADNEVEPEDENQRPPDDSEVPGDEPVDARVEPESQAPASLLPKNWQKLPESKFIAGVDRMLEDAMPDYPLESMKLVQPRLQRIVAETRNDDSRAAASRMINVLAKEIESVEGEDDDARSES